MSLLQLLRRETGQLHQKLDDGLAGGALTSRGDYVRFLVMHARVLPGIERELAKSVVYQSFTDWNARFRTAALLTDLDALHQAVPEAMEILIPAGRGSIAGVMYVLEGSRLGGRLIARKLAEAGLDSLPTRFICHGSEHDYWRTFQQWLAQHDTDCEAMEDAVASAKILFEKYILAMRMGAYG